jgi:hypothetical protein
MKSERRELTKEGRERSFLAILVIEVRVDLLVQQPTFLLVDRSQDPPDTCPVGDDRLESRDRNGDL